MGRKKNANGWDQIDGGAGFVIPLTLLRHRNFMRLSAHAVKLLLDLSRQYTGFNNGYLCASWSLMRDAGWNSTHTVQKAMLELEHYNIIVRTQQGSQNKPNLHALTWRKIDEKPKQPIDATPTSIPPNSWKHDAIPDFVMPAPKPRKGRRPRLKVAA